jgi:hypothetical protein
MGKHYWIGRQRAAIGMAHAASSAEARLIHYELAGRYSLQAAMSPPFMLPLYGPATEGEQAALRLADRPAPRPREPDEPGAAAAARR